MLILTRRPNEAVRIGKYIRIVVLGSKGYQIRLGIEAPTVIPVDREEIYLRKLAGVHNARARSGPVRTRGTRSF